MNVRELRDALSTIPDAPGPPLTPAIEDGIAKVAADLASDAAVAAITLETYWPKWDGPWWQMVLLWELGAAAQIPRRAARATVESLEALPLHSFPIRADDWPKGNLPEGSERARGASCHCAIGSMDQVLTACGIEVDRELPWVLPWYLRYHMSDGGLNYDETAYLVTDECASSMVATVPVFEAMLRRGPSAWLERGAAFLVERALHLGSLTRHNAEERTSAAAWPKLLFPRFYLYDVLRGASALVRWAELARIPVPVHALAILARLPREAIVRVERTVPAMATWRGKAGTWQRESSTGTFPLLAAVSELGAPSPWLTAEWQRTRRATVELIDAGLVSDQATFRALSMPRAPSRTHP
ncbi:hypothetical protein BH11MYX1_BH11MYX1_57400 [soil metagenome]